MIITEYAGTTRGLEGLSVKVSEAARMVVTESTAMVTREAQVNANTGAHLRGEGHIPGSGPGPNVVTGTLKRSIQPTPTMSTTDGWMGTAGPHVVYARAIELGHPRWKNGATYPYLGPAIRAWRERSTGLIRDIMNHVLRG